MRWFIFLPLAVLVVLFLLSNPQSIELRLWPFDVAWAASAAIAVLSIAAFAFLLGALIAWAAALPARRRGRAGAGRCREAAHLDRVGRACRGLAAYGTRAALATARSLHRHDRGRRDPRGACAAGHRPHRAGEGCSQPRALAPGARGRL